MQDFQHPLRILVVGGGSAGWITANLLNATLGQSGQAKIAVVESPDIAIIGVGEATVPSVRRTLQTIGIPEKQFMQSCEATFKNAIRFVDWNWGQQFDHPFDRRQRPETDALVRNWLAQSDSQSDSQSSSKSFDKSFSLLSNMCDHYRAPKALGWPDYGSTFPYAYHLDAVLLAKTLTEWGTARGIDHKLANVTDVPVTADGSVAAVITDSGERLEADLYIDCSGFRGRLLGEALQVAKRQFGDKLLCDRAVTMRVPYETYRPDKLRPFTLATARNAGWSWDINLQSRRGVGYVYSSAFLSQEAAEAELRASEGEHCSALDANHIRFESSKREVSWRGNCVAVGLADGFLEPLESSGLYMIEFAAQALSDLLPGFAQAPDSTRAHFNQLTQSLYEEVAEFINLHYVTSQRRDTEFWRAATDASTVLDSLRDRLELWRSRPPMDMDFTRNLRLFSLESHEYLLMGMNHCAPTGHIPSASQQGTTLPDLPVLVDKCLDKMPLHQEWLKRSLFL